MASRTPTVVIHKPWAGLTVLDLLERRFTYLDGLAWRGEISRGRVHVNGVPAGPNTRLCQGDRLAYQPPGMEEPPVETEYRKIYEDADILVIDKPPNLPCHPGGRYFRNTLWAVLREREGLETIHLVHRLDRETSGIVLIAKTPEAAKRCAAGFSTGEVRKRYLALVEGRFPMAEVAARGWLMTDSQSPVRKKRRFYADDGQPPGSAAEACRTRLRGRAYRNGLTLVEAIPKTGRRHQIRATLLGLGYPVAGDKIYGPDDALFIRLIEDRLTGADRDRLRLNRQALHAAGLAIRHPSSNEQMVFDAPMPPDMASLLS